MSPELDVVELAPWRLEIWEPLTCKVPNPNLAQPYCCYISTVIFYVRPFTVRPWHHIWSTEEPSRYIHRIGCRWHAEKPSRTFEEWGRVDAVLTWDTPFDWKGERFIVGGGEVVYRSGWWWMKHTARRHRDESR
jgi:hypothetical protein